MSGADLRRITREHRGLLAVLALHAVVVAAVVGRASPWATLSLDCVAGTVAEAALFEPGWGPGEVVDGLVWSQALSGLVALPGYAVLGTGVGLVGKVAAWLMAALLLVLVYAVGCRASGKAAGLLAAAGVAFAPPVLFHTSLVLGNWHWTGLLFDYGALLIALRIGWPGDDGAVRWQRWPGFALLGLVCGLAVLNSPKSLPFVAFACGVAALGVGPRRWLRGGLATLAGAVVGGAPLLLHGLVAGGPGEAKGDPIWAQLFNFHPQPGKLWDLVGPTLPRTLHLEDLLGPGAGEATAELWVRACQVGCLVALVGVVWTLRRRDRDGGAIMARLAPLAFVALFAAAYVVIDTRIRLLSEDFVNFRQHSHMMLTSLLVGMAVGAACGWGWLWDRLETVDAAGLRRGLRALLVIAALAPAGVGLTGQAAMANDAPGVRAAGLDAYRGRCFDIPGFFAARRHADAGVEARCAGLSSPEREQDCLTGVAWGLGYRSVRLEAARPYAAARPLPPPGLCRFVPPDEQDRCVPWAAGQQPGLGTRLPEVCDALPDPRRRFCYLGAGWYASQVAWGSRYWPLEACEALADEEAREACWGGPGFHAVDHMAPTPARLHGLLQRVPERRRAAAATGAGLMLGRTWASEAVALERCGQLGAELAIACAGGVELARAQAFGPGGGR